MGTAPTASTFLASPCSTLFLGDGAPMIRLCDTVAHAVEEAALRSLAGGGPAEGYLLGKRLCGPEHVIEIHDLIGHRPPERALPLVVGCYRSRPHVGTELTPGDVHLARHQLGSEGLNVLLVVDPSGRLAPEARFHLVENGIPRFGCASIAFPLSESGMQPAPWAIRRHFVGRPRPRCRPLW